MSLTVAIAALVVEGLIFQILQEPETFARMGYIGKYFTELFRGWAVVMSTASVVLLFLPLVFPNQFKDSSAVPARYIWILAAFCFFATGYQVWRRERTLVEAKDAEIERISRGKGLPLIKGTAFHFRFNGTLSQGNKNGKWHVSSAVTFKVNLCNHNERETNLQDLTLDGSALEPPIEFGSTNVEGYQLPSGQGINISTVMVLATVYGFQHKEDLPIIALDKLKVTVIDGFMHEHLIDVESGETLKFVRNR
jgi:hypothetical protein